MGFSVVSRMEALSSSWMGWVYSVEPMGVSAMKCSSAVPVRPAGKRNWASSVPRRLRRPEKSGRGFWLGWPGWAGTTSSTRTVPVRIAAGRRRLAGVGDDDADGGLAAGEVLALAEDADDRAAQDLRDGFDAFDGGKRAVGVFEAVADALPDDVFERDGLVRRDGLLPGAIAFVDVEVALGTAEDVVFGVEDFGDELAGGFARGVVGDGDRQGAAGVGGGKRLGLGVE